MNADIWAILAVGAALGSLVWQMLRSLRLDMAQRFGEVNRKFDAIDDKFVDVDRRIEENFRDVRNRLDRLAADHHGLARELSEMRGELRGRLDERARPAPG